MDQMTLRDVPVYFTAEHKSPQVPAWARHLNAQVAPWVEVMESKPPGGIVVLMLNSVKYLLSDGLGNHLNKWLTQNAWPGHFVFQFRQKEDKLDGLVEVMSRFPFLCSMSEFTWSPSRLEESVNEALVKYCVERIRLSHPQPVFRADIMLRRTDLNSLVQELQAVSVRLQQLTHLRLPAALPSPEAIDPLADVQEVMEATADLHAPSGRLSATQTAAAFGLSVAKLGKIIGSSRQALTQTPDAESIQQALRSFERIVRLRAVLPGEKFLAWLNRDNRHLDGQAPLALIIDGRVGVVADLAEDMLLGTPG